MKKISLLLCGLIGLVSFTSGVAFADRFGVGVYVGGPYPYGFYRPFYRPYFYPYPYPYYPPVVVDPPVVMAPSQPPVYVEQGNVQPTPQQPAASQTSSYWYHCDKPEGYYPYIKQCPGGWKAVEPAPPPPSVPQH